MDKKKYFNMFRNYKLLASNLITNISCYEGWSDSFSRSEVKDLYKTFIKEFKDVDFTQFTIDELKELDFRFWDDNIILMPAWALDCIPNGCEIYSINNTKIIYDENKELDKDSRGGVSAYGFSIAQIRDARINSIIDK